MFIYKISQEKKTESAYVSAVVVAPTYENAAQMHPSGKAKLYGGTLWIDAEGNEVNDWVQPKDVVVEFMGVANQSLEPQVVVACQVI